jgi:hypothetical protein
VGFTSYDRSSFHSTETPTYNSKIEFSYNGKPIIFRSTEGYTLFNTNKNDPNHIDVYISTRSNTYCIISPVTAGQSGNVSFYIQAKAGTRIDFLNVDAFSGIGSDLP